MPEPPAAEQLRGLRGTPVGFTPACAALEPDEEDVFCTHCGTRNPKGTAYCMGCGKSLS